jgi:hypothetical protein
MFLAALIMCISHPGHFLKGPNSEFPKGKAAKAAAKAARASKDQAKLLDPEEGYVGMEPSEVELNQRSGFQTSQYSRVAGAPDAAASRYEPYGGAYGQGDEYYSMGPEAGRTLS